MSIPTGARTLTVVPKAWHSWDFRVLAGDREIALIDRAWFRERATFSLEGRHYEVRRTSVLQGIFTLEHHGKVLAEARKRSAFRRVFDVRIGTEAYRLKAASPFRREFRLLRGGIQVGSMRPPSFIRRTAVVHFPETISLPARLFLVFLVLVLWKRTADAAGGGA